MVIIHRYALFCALILVLSGCANVPKIEKPQFTQRHYTYSVLLVPEKPGNSPQLELAMSLLHMEYPAVQAGILHDILYGQTNIDAYRDLILSEQRRNYRSRAGDFPPSDGSGTASFNWRYAEKFSIKQIFERGIVIERDLETYSGGAHPARVTQYYNIEIEGDGFKHLDFDDLFYGFLVDHKYRDIVYGELRTYSNLDATQSLSQGIYFNNQPELTFNFFLTEDGLGLHWDPAQIAPHAHGSIQIILPWLLIRPLIPPASIELLTRFNIYLFANSEE